MTVRQSEMSSGVPACLAESCQVGVSSKENKCRAASIGTHGACAGLQSFCFVVETCKPRLNLSGLQGIKRKCNYTRLVVHDLQYLILVMSHLECRINPRMVGKYEWNVLFQTKQHRLESGFGISIISSRLAHDIKYTSKYGSFQKHTPIAKRLYFDYRKVF